MLSSIQSAGTFSDCQDFWEMKKMRIMLHLRAFIYFYLETFGTFEVVVLQSTLPIVRVCCFAVKSHWIYQVNLFRDFFYEIIYDMKKEITMMMSRQGCSRISVLLSESLIKTKFEMLRVSEDNTLGKDWC